MYEERWSPMQDSYLGKAPSYLAVPCQAQPRDGEKIQSWAGIRDGGRLIGTTFLVWVMSFTFFHLRSKVNIRRPLPDEGILSCCLVGVPVPVGSPVWPACPFSLEGEHHWFTVGLVNLGGEPSMVAHSKHVISRYFIFISLSVTHWNTSNTTYNVAPHSLQPMSWWLCQWKELCDALLGLLGARGSKSCCSFVVSKILCPNSTPKFRIKS